MDKNVFVEDSKYFELSSRSLEKESKLMVYKRTRLKLNSIVFFIEHDFYNSQTAYSLTPLVSEINTNTNIYKQGMPKDFNELSARIISDVFILLYIIT